MPLCILLHFSAQGIIVLYTPLNLSNRCSFFPNKDFVLKSLKNAAHC